MSGTPLSVPPAVEEEALWRLAGGEIGPVAIDYGSVVLELIASFLEVVSKTIDAADADFRRERDLMAARAYLAQRLGALVSWSSGRTSRLLN